MSVLVFGQTEANSRLFSCLFRQIWLTFLMFNQMTSGAGLRRSILIPIDTILTPQFPADPAIQPDALIGQRTRRGDL